MSYVAGLSGCNRAGNVAVFELTKTAEEDVKRRVGEIQNAVGEKPSGSERLREDFEISLIDFY